MEGASKLPLPVACVPSYRQRGETTVGVDNRRVVGLLGLARWTTLAVAGIIVDAAASSSRFRATVGSASAS